MCFFFQKQIFQMDAGYPKSINNTKMMKLQTVAEELLN